MLADVFEKKIFLLSCLEKFLGEQKIDIVISKDADREIEQKMETDSLIQEQ